MSDYDIGETFAQIEDELISSMIRNLKRHRVEEITEGIEWTQWQVKQLKALEDYKRRNAAKFSKEYSTINDRIRQALQDSYHDGTTSQERKILQAIKRGYKGKGTNKPAFTGSASVTGEFFKTNDRKLDALLKATSSDMHRAETAVLRMSDDKYRKIIFNAQVYANTGAGTYAKAVDMATKDFLSAGINCIEYKNGRRVNIRSYADMAIRTANKRAYLQGEGAMRREWGIHTVILNKRTNACPLCMPFVGKIFIDDVWSGGTVEESEKTGYPLLSEAIAQGLYHPNCQDSHTTYFDDILAEEDEEDTAPLTKKEQKQYEELYATEQKQHYALRQSERMERMSKYSLDEDNRRAYGSRAEAWREKAEELNKEVKRLQDDAPKDRFAENSKSKVENTLTVVNAEILKSPEFRKHIDKLGESSKISREIYQQTRNALQHRSGTDFEDLIFIDSLTGKSMVRNDYDVPKQCIPSKQMRKMVNAAGAYTIIAVHNHPNSSVPSFSDIHNARKKRYKYGVIACHNGNIFKYTILGDFNDFIVESLLDSLNKLIYNKDSIKNYDEIFLRTLEQLKENNVKLEVFLWK